MKQMECIRVSSVPDFFGRFASWIISFCLQRSEPKWTRLSKTGSPIFSCSAGETEGSTPTALFRSLRFPFGPPPFVFLAPNRLGLANSSELLGVLISHGVPLFTFQGQRHSEPYFFHRGRHFRRIFVARRAGRRQLTASCPTRRARVASHQCDAAGRVRTCGGPKRKVGEQAGRFRLEGPVSDYARGKGVGFRLLLFI